MDRVVMIWLDGFSSRYLNPEKTPFISELAHSGISATVEPLFAFAGIGVSAFTGVSINTHKVWTDYVYDRSTAYPAVLKYLLNVCDYLPSDILNPYARYAVCRLFGVNPGAPNLIPISLIDYFRTKEQKRLTGDNPVEGARTLFEQLREYSVPFLTVGFYESIFEKIIVEKVLRALDRDYRFILFRLGSLDKLGHRYGPESEEVTRRISAIDTIVREITEKENRSASKSYFIIFSDHGMVPVREHIDIVSLLKGLPVKMPGDYIMFLNSTVACFWFGNGRAREIISEALGRVAAGTVLNEANLKELEINKIGTEYGELLFALKEGKVFFPDFYRRRKSPKGMHGYAFLTYDRPLFIINSPVSPNKSTESIDARFIDVMPTVLDLLEVPVPESCEGRSLLQG